MTLFENLRRSFAHRAPKLYTWLQEAWTARRINKIMKAIVRENGLVVQTGPFEGLRYLPEAAGSSLLPKLLGSYEAELHETMRKIIDTNYSLIVDVGCAEGYYAVGLAKRLPRAHIFAFDTNPRARQLCEAMANQNGVLERIAVREACDTKHLSSLIQEHTLIICDCEGCELGLLNPTEVPKLKTTDVLVELHDFIDRSISPTIFSRFARTHDISLISPQKRVPSSYRALAPFNEWDQRVAVAEFREQETQWAFMRAKSNLAVNFGPLVSP
jgi:hypothetical protein